MFTEKARQHVRYWPRTSLLWGAICLFMASAVASASATKTGLTSLYFHPPALQSLGIEVSRETSTGLSHRVGGLGFEVTSTNNLLTIRRAGNFKGFESGVIAHAGGLSLKIDGDDYSLEPLQIHVVAPWKMEIRGAKGNAWFVLEHMQQLVGGNGTRLELDNADLAMSPWLADLLQRPDLAGTFMGSANIALDFMPAAIKPTGFSTNAVTPLDDVCSVPVNSGTIDVELTEITTLSQLARVAGDRVAMAPGAKLLNVGSSSVEWFNAIAPDNDIGNHPYLALALYRLFDGRLEQIGQADVKHAFYTVNAVCPCAGGHILFPSCEDTYGTATNAIRRFLAPREEINAFTGEWESNGSHFDGTPANNFRDHLGGPPGTNIGGHGPFEHLLTVQESDLQTPGARYFIEAWYLVRGDANIFNSMGHKEVSPGLIGDVFSFNFVNGAAAPLISGSILDTYVNPNDSAALTANVVRDTGEGRLQVAYRSNLEPDGGVRYEFALMNHDYNRGTTSFSVPLSGGSQVRDLVFIDGDTDVENDWVATQSGSSVTWTAPAGTKLEWGTLYNFSLTSNQPANGNLLKLQVQAPADPTQSATTTLADFAVSSGGCLIQDIRADAVNNGFLSNDCQILNAFPNATGFDDRNLELVTLTLDAPGDLTIDMRSPCTTDPCEAGTLDSLLFLFNAGLSNEIARDDDSGANFGGGFRDAHIDANLPAGTYNILLSSAVPGQSGTYTLTTEFDGGCVTRPLALNTFTSQTLTDDCGIDTLFPQNQDGSFIDSFTIELPVRGTLSVRMSSLCTTVPCAPGTLDSRVGIVDGSQQLIAESDDEAAAFGGGPFDARIDISLDAGTYTIVTNSFNGRETGNYTLANFFVPSELPAHTLTIDNPVPSKGTVTSSPPGINCASDCTETFTVGAKVVLTARAAPGFVFTGWQDRRCSGTGPCVVRVNEATQINAAFDLVPASVVSYAGDLAALLNTHCVSCHNAQSPLAGIAYDSYDAATTNDNAARSVARVNSASFPMPPSSPLTTAEQDLFTAWQSGGFVNNSSTGALPDPSLYLSISGGGTVTSAPAGLSCSATCNSDFPPGTSVTLTATPVNGQAFARWSGAGCDRQPTCTVVLNQSENVSAVFNSNTPLVVGSVLPTSRAVSVDQPATAFATMLNVGTLDAIGCRIAPITEVPGTFFYGKTDPVTNTPDGPLDVPVTIPGRTNTTLGSQTFVFGVKPTAPFAPTNIALSFDCLSGEIAPVFPAINTFLLSATAGPTVDIVALSITPTSDGIVRVPDTGNRSSAFAVAAVNAGSTGDVTVTTDTNGVSVPAVITICQTNTTTGACLANPAPSISLTIAAGETPSFGVFVQATDAIAADAANNRILVRFSNNNQSKGATSVAIQSP